MTKTVKRSVVATDPTRRVSKHWEAVKLKVAKIQFPRVIIFTRKLEFYRWQQVLSIVCLEVRGSSHFQENACQISKLSSVVCQ